MEQVSIQSHLCLNISLDIGWPLFSILSLIIHVYSSGHCFFGESLVTDLSSSQGASITEWLLPSPSLPWTLTAACPQFPSQPCASTQHLLHKTSASV